MTETDMQRSMDLFASGCADFGLTVNTNKTVTMHQQSPNAACSVPRILVNGTELQTVDSFTHFGSALLDCIRIDDEGIHRISKASQAFGRLQNSVWSLHGLQLNTKLKTRKVLVLTTLVYGAVTWTVHSADVRELNHFHLSCLRGIRKPTRQDGVRTGISRTAPKLSSLPVAAAAADESASVENRWCKLRHTVQATALAVPGGAHRQHQEWLDDDDAAISNLIAEKNRLHKAYVNRPTDDNKAAFYCSRRLV
ncbi:hypothetical protein SprV_0602159100 [Sparganum proliferum]